MPAIITHHIFGEDVVSSLPGGLVDSEEELLAFLLGNQGPDPLFARFTTLPDRAIACHRLGHRMQTERTSRSFIALRDAVSRLHPADARIGRAFVLGMLGHYTLDRTAHPFVIGQELALAAADPELLPVRREVHAVIESDIDSWILWQKRHATIEDRPATTNLMRTEKIDRVAGALISQVAYAVYDTQVGASEYGGAVRDYETVFKVIDPAGSSRTRALGELERLIRTEAMVESLAHYVRCDDECPAANLERHAWENPFTGETSNDSFADLFDVACELYPQLAHALVGGNEGEFRSLVANLNYEGRPIEDN